MNELKIGLIGLDTSHAPAFAKLLNDTSAPHHVEGGRIVTAFAGGSPDFGLSRDRIEGFTAQVHDDYGVSLLDSAAAVAESSDAILLTSVDGRVHLKQFQEIAPYGKPVFIDKPMATSVVEARAIANLAKEHNIPLMTSSILRYGQPLIDALESGEKLIGADCSGPMDLEETQPGLFWYGIHTVEMLYAALGGGCEHVTAFTTADSEFVRGVWKDGRVGTIRGSRGGSKQYCALLHGENSSRAVDVLNYPKPAYAGLLEQVLTMFQTGKAPIDIEESLEIMRFIEAANESRQSGARVSL